MDAQALGLRLVAPLCAGDEILPGVTFLGSPSSLRVLLEFEAGAAGILTLEVNPWKPDEPAAARTGHWLIAYRGPSQPLGPKVCQAVAGRTRENEGDAPVPAPSPARKIRSVEVEKLLEPTALDGEFFYVPNPYHGCVIGCRFCYAQNYSPTCGHLRD